MFRATFSPIIRSNWLYLQYLVVFTQVAAGCCLEWGENAIKTSVGSKLGEHYQILQIQSSAPDDGQNLCPKHVELTWSNKLIYTVIPRLKKIIRSGITFVSRYVMLSDVSLLAVSNVNNPVGLVGLLYVMWSAHFVVTHIQTEKISSWNGPTVHVCCLMLARASNETFVSRIHIR
jgi:hypothetical protein